MCFRPADANAPTGVECPHCGKTINIVGGALPKKCPFCREALEAGVKSPAAPAAPGVPGAPGAPKPPTQA